MRLWTIHPAYLDPPGLVALWREALLAQKVLRGQTRGYRHHPQLERFRAHAQPLAAISRYLEVVLAESLARGYRFDATKIAATAEASPIVETRGQLFHEWAHYLRKLETRNPALHRELKPIAKPKPHPLFRLVPGRARSWERSPSME